MADSNETIEEKVKAIIAEQLGAEPDKITDSTHFVQDLGADSLDIVELVMALEEAFDINVPEDATDKIQTVGEAIEYIKQAVGS